MSVLIASKCLHSSRVGIRTIHQPLTKKFSATTTTTATISRQNTTVLTSFSASFHCSSYSTSLSSTSSFPCRSSKTGNLSHRTFSSSSRPCCVRCPEKTLQSHTSSLTSCPSLSTTPTSSFSAALSSHIREFHSSLNKLCVRPHDVNDKAAPTPMYQQHNEHSQKIFGESESKKEETNTGANVEASTTNETTPHKPRTMTEKIKKLMKQYGAIGVATYATFDVFSIAGFYLLVKSGVNVEGFFEWAGLNMKTVSWLPESSGTFVVAFAAHKLFSPVRMLMTVGAVPYVTRALESLGFVNKVAKPTMKEVRNEVSYYQENAKDRARQAHAIYQKKWEIRKRARKMQKRKKI